MEGSSRSVEALKPDIVSTSNTIEATRPIKSDQERKGTEGSNSRPHYGFS